MSSPTETGMSDDQIDAFLGGHETGVLSLARDDEPYSIPVSYGYDATTQTFYMRLVSTPDSEKRAFLESSPECRMVIYANEDEATYRSVIATGVLEQISPDQLSLEQIEQYGNAQRPLFEIWGQDRDELDIQLFEFSPTELSGRRTDIDREDW